MSITTLTAAVPLSIDETIEAIFGPVAEFVSSIVFFSVPVPGLEIKFPLIVGWLVVCGVFFSFYLKFLGLRGIGHAIDPRGASTTAPMPPGRSPTSRPCPPP